MSEIKTFEDAFNIFFKERVTLSNHWVYRVPLEKRVIVLEDIDVESTTCHSRESEECQEVLKNASEEEPDEDDDKNKTDKKNQKVAFP